MYYRIAPIKKRLFWAKILFLLPSAAVLAIPITGNLSERVQTVLTPIIGAFFWAGIIAGIAVNLSIGPVRRRQERDSDQVVPLPRRPGAIRFFSHRGAVTTDAILLLFSVLLIIHTIKHFMPEQLFFVVFACWLYTLLLHGVMNGKNYIFYKKTKSRGIS